MWQRGRISSWGRSTAGDQLYPSSSLGSRKIVVSFLISKTTQQRERSCLRITQGLAKREASCRKNPCRGGYRGTDSKAGICFRVPPVVRSHPTPAPAPAAPHRRSTSQAPISAGPPVWFIHPSDSKAFSNSISAAPRSLSFSHTNAPAVISTVRELKAVCCSNTVQRGGYNRS